MFGTIRQLLDLPRQIQVLITDVRDVQEISARTGMRAQWTNALIRKLEASIMAIRDDFNESLAGLGAAILELDQRIQNFPSDANDVTQADVDAIRSLSSQVKSLAVTSPEVPTDQEATDQEAGQDPSTEQSFGSNFAGGGQANA